MKVLILAGGFGTRLSEETKFKAKTYGRNRWKTNFMAYNEDI